ncbi:MAG TPA: hypothetical protein VMW00_06385 [Dehalococcoidales bacterium]|nr:hypothetical protein [Dehalococcoidales bacterium]
MKQITAKADAKNSKKNRGAKPTPEPSGDGKKRTTAITQTADLGQAQYVSIAPREFRMNASLIWQAREAAILEWGYPADISPEEFLDNYLYISFKQRGIILSSYTVIKPEEEGNHDGDQEGIIGGEDASAN